MKTIILNLYSERKNTGLDGISFKQGNFNREFDVTLFDDGVKRTLLDGDKPTVIFDYYTGGVSHAKISSDLAGKIVQIRYW